MGLIQAALGAVTGTLADTWKDYFVCDAMDNNTLMVKGTKKGKGLFDSNDVISNGSGIVVAEGQCALVVDEGKIVEVAAEPGNYTYDSSTSPSIFAGGWEGIKETFQEMLSRFTYGGQAAKDQRVYYVNTKEVMGNMYGTATPIPFRLIDKNIGLDVDISVRCNGQYSFQIVNPLLFYQNVACNTTGAYTKDALENQMKTELLTALQGAFSVVSATGVRYSELPGHTSELVDALNVELNEKWTNLRGIKIVSLGINSVSISKEDEDLIKGLQINMNQQMAAANLAAAKAQAIKDAANNPNGAVAGIYGMNAVAGAGDDLNAMYAAGAAANAAKAAAQTEAPNPNAWTCECGSVNDGNFCPKCGKPKPAARFCPQCGKEVDADAKFCPYCGVQL